MLGIARTSIVSEQRQPRRRTGFMLMTGYLASDIRSFRSFQREAYYERQRL